MNTSLTGAALRHLRRRQDRSARAVSLAAGLSPAYACKLETGHVADPSLRAFARLAVELGMTRDEVWVCIVAEARREAP